MRIIFQCLSVMLILSLTAIGCENDSSNQLRESPIQGSFEIEENQHANEMTYLNGGTVYVPIYTSIFHYKDFRTYDLSATLSIHNIDLHNSIKIVKADYYNTNGDLIKEYVGNILILKPLQTVQIVIHENDKSGGTGANFIVEWVSETNVNSPIIEAVMISTSGQQGISFTSTGKIIQKYK